MTAVLDSPVTGAPAPGDPRASGPRSSEMAHRLWPAMPSDRWLSWVVTLAVTGFGAALRWPSLNRPHAFSFDETYYAKDAFALLEFGHEREFVEDANEQILASNGDPATLMGVFGDGPAYVVHPPGGKWVIAFGEHLFGITPFGWRFMVAVLGTLAVLITVRVGRRLTRSTLIGGMAGLFVALDGLAIVHSRTALLDPILMFWILVAFAALLLDRDRTRRRLADRVLEYPDDIAAAAAARDGSFHVRLGWRPWLWAAGIALGLACGTKWSAAYVVVAFALLVLLWDASTRRIVGMAGAWWATLVRTLPMLALTFGVVVVVVYLATWAGWFLTDGGYYRDWGATHEATGVFSLVPDSLRSLWHYHAEALRFHTNLDSPHSYQSNPWGWPLQARPTSYYFQSPVLGEQGCTVDKCAAEVVSLGNPVIWWAGALALLHQLWRAVGRRDWRSGAVVIAYAAGWMPWLFFQHRTIFTFYAVVMVPFLALALAMTLGAVIGSPRADPTRRAVGAAVAGSVVLLAVVAAYWFYPVWTAQLLTYAQWSMRMWLPTWI